MKLTAQLNFEPRLGVSGSKLPPPLYAFMKGRRTILLLIFLLQNVRKQHADCEIPTYCFWFHIDTNERPEPAMLHVM